MISTNEILRQVGMPMTIQMFVQQEIRERGSASIQEYAAAVIIAIELERDRCEKIAKTLLELMVVSIDPHPTACHAARLASDAIAKIRSGQ